MEINMETLFNGYTLDVPQGVFPLSTDSIVLADFVRLGKNEKIVDFGSGCGTLGLLLCAKDPHCFVTGVEIGEASHQAALENIRANNLQSRMVSVCADLLDFAANTAPGSFSVCVSNPPYFSGGPSSTRFAQARREQSCDLSQLFSAAERLLKWGGYFYLVHRPERLAELCHQAAAHNMQPKRICFVRHHPGSEVSTVLLACKKGANPGNTLTELTLFDEAGNPTDDYRRIYHI